MTSVLLERANRSIPDCAGEDSQRLVELRVQFREYLDHSELELALDVLQEIGEIMQCRGGFWRDLERAASAMKLEERAQRLHERFLAVLPDGNGK